MKHWQSLSELFDLYGIDKTRGGGQMFLDLILMGRILRHTGYSVRDYAVAYRTRMKYSPMVHCSLMRKALWALLDASDEEWKEMEIEPAHNVYDLAEHIIDKLPAELCPDEEEAAQQARAWMEAHSIWPRPYTKPDK